MIRNMLVVEDNPGDARLLREMLNDEGWLDTEMIVKSSMHEAEAHLAHFAVDIVLLDLGLPDAQGIAAVQRVHKIAPRIPLVVLTGLDDEAIAIEAMQEGAQDYLIKGQATSTIGQVERRGLLRALRYAIERKTLEETLFLERDRALVTLNSIGDAVACTDTYGNLTFLNIVAEKLTGWSMKEAEGLPMRDVVRILNSAGPELVQFSVRHESSYEQPTNVPSDSTLIRRDGTEVPVEQSIAPILDRDGLITGAVMVLRDVSAARATALQIAHSAEHDFLTGLPNRLLLNDRISQAIALAPRHHRRVAVLFLDLDGFKHINDSLGHSIGDKLLQSVANRLVGCARVSDTVSRQGGDEFVVLLSEVEHATDAGLTARRMLQAMAETHSIDQHDLHVSTSIGVSVYPDDGTDAETLIKNADTAMYQAKENGRQSFRFFKPIMNVRAVERQSIEEDLRRAIERKEFILNYQPKINLKTGEICGVEALIRWRHPKRGLVSPMQFIPVAEASGLIQPIGAWVLYEACRQTGAWADAGLPATKIAVNVSGMAFHDENFQRDVFCILDKTGLNPKCLELELTESVLMSNSDETASILQAFREKGIRIAIDDFGTGYSSLSYLRKFPVDTLKIDQSFVRQIGGQGNDTVLVAAVIGMARSLKLRVVAEGVETLEQLTFLRDHQADEAQGYYFSQPVAAAQFAVLLKNGIPEATSRYSAQHLVA